MAFHISGFSKHFELADRSFVKVRRYTIREAERGAPESATVGWVGSIFSSIGNSSFGLGLGLVLLKCLRGLKEIYY